MTARSDMEMTRHNTPRWLLLGWNVNDLFLRSFGTVDVGNVPSNFSCDVSFIVPGFLRIGHNFGGLHLSCSGDRFNSVVL